VTYTYRSLLGMWTVTAYETKLAPLGLFPRSPEEMLRTAGLYYASTPTRDPEEGA
jgi:hypothetical protein